MHVKIRASQDTKEWWLTNFYGSLETDNKQDSWNLLVDINKGNGDPSCVIGYFNKILIQYEKQGGRCQAPSLIGKFRNAMSPLD